MEKKIFETRLETLLLHKTFSALSEDEKKYALSILTEEEYHEYALLVSNYKPALLTGYDNMQPSPKVLETLSQAFRTQHQQKATLFDLTTNWRLLSVAAAMLIMIGYVIFFLQSDKKTQPIVAKTNKRQPVNNNIHSILKQEIKLAKNHTPGPGKQVSSFNARNSDKNLCLDITIDSLADMPCLNPMTTMFTIADPDDDSTGF